MDDTDNQRDESKRLGICDNYKMRRPKTCVSIFFANLVLPPLIVYLLYMYSWSVPPCPGTFLNSESTLHNLILTAGNANNDTYRNTVIEEIKTKYPNTEGVDALWKTSVRYANPGRSDFVSEMKEEVEHLGETGYLGGYFWDIVWPMQLSKLVIGFVYPYEVEDSSPLYPLWCYYRGRMMGWCVLENNILEKWMYREGNNYLKCASRHFPENEILGMYLGKGVEWEDPDIWGEGGAPEWAETQRMAMVKLKEVTDWWIDERQIENGEFGGGWNDDVEFWRQVLPLVLGFEDPKLLESLKLLGRGLWDLKRMELGFVDELHDVEHSAEESSDSMLPLMLSDIDDAEWLTNSEKISNLFTDLWTATNDKGMVAFQSTFFSSIEVSKDERMMCDVALNIRAIQPVLLAWQFGRLSSEVSFKFEEKLKGWMRNWINVEQGGECGKPVRVMPSAVRFPAGSPGGPLTSGWQMPGCKYVCMKVRGRSFKVCGNHADAFTWPSAVSPLHEVMALTAYKTESCEFLRPLKDAVAINAEVLEENPGWNGEEIGAEQSSEWVKSKVMKTAKAAILKHKFFTDGYDTEYDSTLITEYGSDAYTALLLSNTFGVDFSETADSHWSSLTESMSSLLNGFTHNFESLTSEVRFTDRTFKFYKFAKKSNHDNVYSSPDGRLLYNVVTGDLGNPFYSSLIGVTWKGTNGGEDLTAVVVENGRTRIGASFYNFRGAGYEVEGVFKRLESGSYEVSVEVIAEGGENDLSVCDNMVTNVESFEVGEAEWKRCEASEERSDEMTTP
ncbi:hypothetical protein TrLO_g2787 [Triparma laevis f. longispina]|uniref:Uncharacterized protein n=1 Tax=Triparma laevis f. longispina TaxID=1714387 RepID=A0A9W7FUL9_9STRA|nr:hypothetical protein TrLO_g2787 [Triparma laevis f. longispina]